MSYIGAEPDGMGKAQRFTYTATGTGTAVTADDDGIPIGYTAGQVSVYLNGVKQVIPTDVVASNGSTITFVSSYASGDVIEVVALSIFSATTVEGTALISTGETGTSKFLRIDGDGTSSWAVPEGANINSTGETGTSKFLRIDGDGTSSWQTVPSTLAGLTDATVSSSDPVIASNPSAVGHYWINSTSGEAYICTDATAGANIWTNIGPGIGDVDPSYSIDFLVIAGGGGGSSGYPSGGGGGGGGAGGYRTSYGSGSISGALSTVESDLTLNPATVYTVTVGQGGTISSGHGSAGGTSSITGSDITDITTVGGGYGGWEAITTGSATILAGGSGGGADQHDTVGGNGTANQGFAGGTGSGNGGGGGGGAGSVGANLPANDVGGAGGAGISSSITGSAVTRGGGGGGSSNTTGGSPHAGGGGGGAAADGTGGTGTAGAANFGAGGGGAYATNAGGAGGSGVVILRMPDGDYSGTTTGSPTVATGVGGTDTVITFNGDGSYTG